MAIACRTRSGTLVGPGICRKWRPVCGRGWFRMRRRSNQGAGQSGAGQSGGRAVCPGNDGATRQAEARGDIPQSLKAAACLRASVPTRRKVAPIGVDRSTNRLFKENSMRGSLFGEVLLTALLAASPLAAWAQTGSNFGFGGGSVIGGGGGAGGVSSGGAAPSSGAGGTGAGGASGLSSGTSDLAAMAAAAARSAPARARVSASTA